MTMSEQELAEATERVIAFLEDCGERDIEAGIGCILGLWGEKGIADFKAKICEAIRGDGEIAYGGQ